MFCQTHKRQKLRELARRGKLSGSKQPLINNSSQDSHVINLTEEIANYISFIFEDKIGRKGIY